MSFAFRITPPSLAFAGVTSTNLDASIHHEVVCVLEGLVRFDFACVDVSPSNERSSSLKW
jgi:hypothetical protein